MIAVDTNLLIYAHRAGASRHRAARQALERAANDDAGWGIVLASLAEFWSVTTHPASTGRPSTPADASAFLLSLVQSGGAQLWQPGPGFTDRLLALAVDRHIQGPRIFDLQIAPDGGRERRAGDLDPRPELLSLPGLRVRDPFA